MCLCRHTCNLAGTVHLKKGEEQCILVWEIICFGRYGEEKLSPGDYNDTFVGNAVDLAMLYTKRHLFSMEETNV